MFQSTRPVRGATFFCVVIRGVLLSFNPRAPCGARLSPLTAQGNMRRFQSTRPVRGATSDMAPCTILLQFQSTRPVRGATEFAVRVLAEGMVSIHAPRAGRDRNARAAAAGQQGFNPRAPCGARLTWGPSSTVCRCFNPRAPCGARHYSKVWEKPLSKFQSTRPVRGATGRASCNDCSPSSFNPRAPCGARRHGSNKQLRLTKFQSTRPVRGATPEVKAKYMETPVSIHAPRAGRDIN